MEIPLETSESYKYILAYFQSDLIYFVAVTLEKLGICSEVKFLRAALKFGVSQKDKNLHIRNELFDNVPVRIYEPKQPFTELRRCILYIHGGVGMVGTIRCYAGMCRRLARDTESVLVNIGYRLAPEHPHPAQFMDCMSATIHFLKAAKNYGVDPNRIVIAGDSSGGTLAALVCQHLVTRKDIPRIRAQVLIYPPFQAIDATLPSYQQNNFVPVLSQKKAFQFAAKFVNEDCLDVSGFMKNAHVPDDLAVKYKKWISADCIPDELKVRGYIPIAPAPFSGKLCKIAELSFNEEFCPLLFKDDIIRQLPETFLLTCEYDVLRDDGVLYKKRLEDNSVPVTWLHLKKGFHGILMQHDLVPFQFNETENAMKDIADFVQRF